METKVCKCCGRELPIESFSRNWHGYTAVCVECNKKNRSEAAKKRGVRKSTQTLIEEARTLRLQAFTPRELMDELVRRGYRGKLEYVETHIIDLSNY